MPNAGVASPGSTYGYNGVQYPTMEAALAAKNSAPGSKAATANGQAAVTGINSAAGGSGVNNVVGAGGGEGSNYTVDTNGNTSYTVTPNLIGQNAAVDTAARDQTGGINAAAAKSANDYAQQQEAQKAALAQKNWDSRFAVVQGATPVSPHVDGGVSGQLSPQETAARAAAFARAKDQAGMTANAALEGLRAATTSRGLGGSTIEGEDMARILGGGAGEINNYTGQQLSSDLGRISDVSDRNYAGDITQRGQDMSAKQALLAIINSGGLY